MSTFGDWFVGVRNGIEQDVESIFDDAESAAELFVEDLVSEIEKVGPTELASIVTTAITANTTNGTLNLSGAITSAVAAAKTALPAALESVVTGAVAAAATSFATSVAATSG